MFLCDQSVFRDLSIHIALFLAINPKKQKRRKGERKGREVERERGKREEGNFFKAAKAHGLIF